MVPSALYCVSCGKLNQPQAKYCFACGQPMQAVPTSTLTGLLTPNYLLKNRYCILSQIGKGGFGAVYKAEDTLFNNRLVAVKEMSQSGLNQQELAEAVDAFKHEAYMLANLDDQSLSKIHDYFNEIGRWYLVMDFIEGESLEEYLSKGGRLPLKQEALDIGIQLCTVLDYLHNRRPPIIFRDLKPSNIMRNPNGHLYLIDFGIARHFKPGQQKDTIAFGSPGYAAPEQYGKAQTTPQSDIYSLGALLHYLVSGHDPSTNTPDPFTFPPPPNVPLELERLIWRMVQKNAAKRPASMTAVKQELQWIATQLRGKVPTPPIQLPNPPQRSLLMISHQLMHQVLQLAHAALLQAVIIFKKVPSRAQAVITSVGSYLPKGKKGLRLLRIVLAVIVIVAFLSGLAIFFMARSAPPNPYSYQTGRLELNDSLRDNSVGNQWEVRRNSYSSCSFTGGAYHISISLSDHFNACIALHSHVSNFTAEVRMLVLKGDCGGIIFRRNGSRFYSFRVCTDGSYTFVRYKSDTNIALNLMLKSGTHLAIHRGLNQTNLLRVVAVGSKIDLYVNSQLITSVKDTSYADGQIGLLAKDRNNVTEVAFSNLMLWRM